MMADRAQGTHLDPWQDAYAAKAANLKESEIRALFAVVSRPEVVSLAGGMPNISDLPLAQLADSARQLIIDHGTQALQYGSGQGWEPFLDSIAEVMAAEHISADPGNISVTTGSQQALDIITQLFINPGDVILAESPSYVGALGVFAAQQADVRHVPMDENGLIPEALEQSILDLKAKGHNLKFVYTVPNYHNPTGVTMSVERRQRVAQICEAHHLLIVEDNPYGLLGFDGRTFPAIQTFWPDGVVYLGSFSKIFAPGFRIGWAYAPAWIRKKIVLALESAILSPSMVGQMALHAYLRDYDWQGQVATYRSMYQSRRDAMVQAIAEYLPDSTWTVPDGGFYTWVKLPDGLNAKAMLPRAVAGLVAYTPGTAFYADDQGADFMRLSFCYPPEDEIREGVRRIATVVDRERELQHMFSSGE
ncbi:MAG: PLP-dependent aminotransferase family protein [Actinomycetaceae bacterium]|nr:PLP-dependent aminotransferase family protein [Actinomycetaceae bacterium]MDU0969962.1 PLP-dependent aminotransferase family protein [Actinomycetaceae bacterium]